MPHLRTMTNRSHLGLKKIAQTLALTSLHLIASLFIRDGQG